MKFPQYLQFWHKGICIHGSFQLKHLHRRSGTELHTCSTVCLVYWWDRNSGCLHSVMFICARKCRVLWSYLFMKYQHLWIIRQEENIKETYFCVSLAIFSVCVCLQAYTADEKESLLSIGTGWPLLNKCWWVVRETGILSCCGWECKGVAQET